MDEQLGKITFSNGDFLVCVVTELSREKKKILVTIPNPTKSKWLDPSVKMGKIDRKHLPEYRK